MGIGDGVCVGVDTGCEGAVVGMVSAVTWAHPPRRAAAKATATRGLERMGSVYGSEREISTASEASHGGARLDLPHRRNFSGVRSAASTFICGWKLQSAWISDISATLNEPTSGRESSS